MGTYDTRGGHPRHDPAADHFPPECPGCEKMQERIDELERELAGLIAELLADDHRLDDGTSISRAMKRGARLLKELQEDGDGS